MRCRAEKCRPHARCIGRGRSPSGPETYHPAGGPDATAFEFVAARRMCAGHHGCEAQCLVENCGRSESMRMNRQLLSGDEAVALAALHAGVALGTGYPGTPSTEILESFSQLGGRAQWAPNEKVALEVGLGAAFANARVLVTMKHVGLNVAADPLFTAAYTGVSGALIVVSADDPGMSSSQNEQDNRRYAVAAGLPAIEPADSQEAYDFFFTAIEISERWHLPVIFRMTTRVCHSKSTVVPRNGGALGIIASGVSYLHAAEAAPGASFLKIGLVNPLPLEKARVFVAGVDRAVVIEEGDPIIADSLRASGIAF